MASSRLTELQMLWELLDGDKVRKSIFSVFLYLNRFFPFFLNRERVSLPVKQRAGLSFFTFFSSQVNMCTSCVGVQFVYVNLKNHTLLPSVQICLTAWPENVHNLKPYHKFETEKKQHWKWTYCNRKTSRNVVWLFLLYKLWQMC